MPDSRRDSAGAVVDEPKLSACDLRCARCGAVISKGRVVRRLVWVDPDFPLAGVRLAAFHSACVYRGVWLVGVSSGRRLLDKLDG